MPATLYFERHADFAAIISRCSFLERISTTDDAEFLGELRHRGIEYADTPRRAPSQPKLMPCRRRSAAAIRHFLPPSRTSRVGHRHIARDDTPTPSLPRRQHHRAEISTLQAYFPDILAEYVACRLPANAFSGAY